jgi:tRNA(fMet)-specific endonuclease VapC
MSPPPRLLDTNVISDMMRNLQGVAAQRARTASQTRGSEALCTSIVVQCELEFGLARKSNPRLDVAYRAVMESVDVLPLGPDVASHYARLRTALEAAGQPMGANDLLIAAHALSLNAILVSADAAFERIPGLQLENWLAPENTKKTGS